MSNWGRMGMAGLVGVVLGGLGVSLFGMQGAAAPKAPADRAAIEAIVRDYILANPEIIPQAIERLQGRQTAKAIETNRKAIETPFAGAWAGAADGDVVLVEYFDYACGYCRASVKDVDRLLAEDKKLKVVFKELPVLGDASDEAARVSLAAARQGKFLPLHRSLYASGTLTSDKIAAVWRTAGLDGSKLMADIRSPEVAREIDDNLGVARALGMSGTPSFVVGDQVLNGAVGYAKLKEAIAAARAAR